MNYPVVFLQDLLGHVGVLKSAHIVLGALHTLLLVGGEDFVERGGHRPTVVGIHITAVGATGFLQAGALGAGTKGFSWFWF